MLFSLKTTKFQIICLHLFTFVFLHLFFCLKKNNESRFSLDVLESNMYILQNIHSIKLFILCSLNMPNIFSQPNSGGIRLTFDDKKQILQFIIDNPKETFIRVAEIFS